MSKKEISQLFALQVMPPSRDRYPTSQKHLYDPWVLRQCWLHGCSSLHSSMSKGKINSVHKLIYCNIV